VSQQVSTVLKASKLSLYGLPCFLWQKGYTLHNQWKLLIKIKDRGQFFTL